MDASSTSSVGAGASAAEAPQLDQLDTVDTAPLRYERIWFAVYIAWLAGLTLAALGFARLAEQAVSGAQRGWLLAMLCFYLSLCNGLVPLPTAWIVMYVASPAAGLVDALWLRVLVVALAASLATVMANLNEYHVLCVLLRYRVGRRVRRTRIYQRAIRWFDQAPFFTLLLAALVPIPIDAIRWLAILRRYSRVRFGLAYFVGRLLRYGLWAVVAGWGRLTGPQIALIQLGLVLAAAAARFFRRAATPGRLQAAPC
jgi:membrane protein YqaA with SNARE-associated domain